MIKSLLAIILIFLIAVVIPEEVRTAIRQGIFGIYDNVWHPDNDLPREILLNISLFHSFFFKSYSPEAPAFE